MISINDISKWQDTADFRIMREKSAGVILRAGPDNGSWEDRKFREWRDQAEGVCVASVMRQRTGQLTRSPLCLCVLGCEPHEILCFCPLYVFILGNVQVQKVVLFITVKFDVFRFGIPVQPPVPVDIRQSR